VNENEKRQHEKKAFLLWQDAYIIYHFYPQMTVKFIHHTHTQNKLGAFLRFQSNAAAAAAMPSSLFLHAFPVIGFYSRSLFFCKSLNQLCARLTANNNKNSHQSRF
jgi:hypothetical protein